MSEPLSSSGILWGIKYLFTKYALTIVIFSSSVTASAIQEVKKHGWLGWGVFFGNIILAVASGGIMYSFFNAIIPSYAITAGYVGAYSGPTSINFVWRVIKITVNTKI
jgi:hypothetical protein